MILIKQKILKLNLAVVLIFIPLVIIVLLSGIYFTDVNKIRKLDKLEIDRSNAFQLPVNSSNKLIHKGEEGKILGSTDVSQESSEDIPLYSRDEILGLGISANINLLGNDSVVRIIMIDTNDLEYLVYETYPLIAEADTFVVDKTCEETCVLENIDSSSIRTEIINAEVEIKDIYSTSGISDLSTREGTSQTIILAQEEFKAQQETTKIEILNRNIQTHDLGWEADMTEFTNLSYSEKKENFSDYINEDGILVNLQGLEYYSSGTFTTLDDTVTASEIYAPPTEFYYIEDFSWRDYLGVNWNTVAKHQSPCNTCWLHGTASALETNLNLHYNYKYDVDLSEQQVLNCTNRDCATGGLPTWVLQYARDSGIGMEECYTWYQGDKYSDPPVTCPSDNTCLEDDEVIIQSYQEIGPGDRNIFALKQQLIERGGIAIGVNDLSISWTHLVELVGFREIHDGTTEWLIKDSKGPNWGLNGYAWIKMADYSTRWTMQDVTFLDRSEDIVCEDQDNDGYCYWGITDSKPTTCPASCSGNTKKDCNDLEGSLIERDIGYFCQGLATGTLNVTILDPLGNPITENIELEYDSVYLPNFENVNGVVSLTNIPIGKPHKINIEHPIYHIDNPKNITIPAMGVLNITIQMLNSSKGSIEGNVKNFYSLTPIDYATLVIDDIPTTSVSDVNGYFVIHNVDSGLHTLGIVKNGYTIESTTEFEVRHNKTTSDIEIFMIEDGYVPPTLYVSPAGNDIIGDGSSDNPYLSITHTLEVIRINNYAGATIIVADGTYTDDTAAKGTKAEVFPLVIDIPKITLQGSSAYAKIVQTDFDLALDTDINDEYKACYYYDSSQSYHFCYAIVIDDVEEVAINGLSIMGFDGIRLGYPEESLDNDPNNTTQLNITGTFLEVLNVALYTTSGTNVQASQLSVRTGYHYHRFIIPGYGFDQTKIQNIPANFGVESWNKSYINIQSSMFRVMDDSEIIDKCLFENEQSRIQSFKNYFYGGVDGDGTCSVGSRNWARTYSFQIDPGIIEDVDGSYSLKSNSPLIDAGSICFYGMTGNCLLMDYDYYGLAPDIGPVEYREEDR